MESALTEMVMWEKREIGDFLTYGRCHGGNIGDMGIYGKIWGSQRSWILGSRDASRIK